MEMKYIGIDLGGTDTKIALVSATGRILERRCFSTKSCADKNALIKAIAENVNQLKKKGASGVGIGVPGLVDSKTGMVHKLTNVVGWKNVNLKKELEKKTGIKTYVDNDVNLMALAETRYGAARNSLSVFCITLGTGVGGGIVINNEVYRGGTQSAGEIGHVCIEQNGTKCNCGRRGCVEAYVGNSYIVNRAERKIKNGARTILKPGRLTPKIIADAAGKGDRFAIDIWKETAEYLGMALVMVVNVFNPEVIVIGGGMIGAGSFLFKPLRDYVKKNAMSIPADKVKIVKAKLGNDAGVIGAAQLANENN